MRIDVLCTDGSPLGVTFRTLWGDSWRIGVGGAELALLTMCEEWAKAGYEVVLYNDPRELDASPFEQRTIDSFEPLSKRDILVVFRTPNPKAKSAKGLRVWWSTDQYTSVPFSSFAPFVHKIVCISKFHADYFRSVYGIDNAVIIDLPVRIEDFRDLRGKDENKIIFTSVPDRGLRNLLRLWDRILQVWPSAHLTITSDYRLWGVGAQNEQHRIEWMNKRNVRFLGALPRLRYLEELSTSKVLLYPSSYEELFCYSVAEALVAGCRVITSSVGALSTTNIDVVLSVDANNPANDPLFIREVERIRQGEGENKFLSSLARDRFSPKRILRQWDEKVFS